MTSSTNSVSMVCWLFVKLLESCFVRSHNDEQRFQNIDGDRSSKPRPAMQYSNLQKGFLPVRSNSFNLSKGGYCAKSTDETLSTHSDIIVSATCRIPKK